MKSMLVIDGSASVARVFAEIFEKRGWNASTCGDHDSAVERLASNTTYDVILLSYRVLGTTGVQLINLIRSSEHHKRTALILITDNDAVTEEAFAAGADEVLLRPLNPNALVWSVDKLVT